MKYVLDASAIMAYLRAEPGGAVVAALLMDPAADCYAHSVNLSREVYDQAVRHSNTTEAEAAIASLYADGVIERKNVSSRFWRHVGDHKARGGVSLPDCICLTLAQELSAELVTGDHDEFEPLAPLGIVPIKFIR